MANTGFKITPTLVQNFVTGPESGSLVSGTFGNFTTQLGVAPFSASLDDENYFYRILDETVCPEGFEDCLSGDSDDSEPDEEIPDEDYDENDSEEEHDFEIVNSDSELEIDDHIY